MGSLCRSSLIRIWPIIHETSWKFSHGYKLGLLQKSSFVQKISASCYCKSYGLYDGEEDAAPEFNRRGAYIEKRRAGWKPRYGSGSRYDMDDDGYIDGGGRSSGYRGNYRHRSLSYDVDEDGEYRNAGPRNTYNHRTPEQFEDYGYEGDTTAGFNEPYDGRQGFDRRSHNRPYNNQYRNSSYTRGPNMYGRRGGFDKYNLLNDRLTDQSNLAKPKFENLEPIKKNLYIEHPDVTSRSMEEVEEYRKTHSMTIKGTDIPKPITKFSELNVSESILRVIKEQNFPHPTPIQAQGWPIALSGRDMIGISQTGSGKTLVFALPAVVHILSQSPQAMPPDYACLPQVLILSPTRELALQTHAVSGIFHHSCGIRSACAYGGASKSVQLAKLQGAHICIATPGRLIDFLLEGSVNLTSCSYLVLDEADRMLDMGFEPQIRKIIGQTRPDRQTLMWSATWPKEVQLLAEDFLSNYVHVTIGSDQLTANPNIEQNIYVLSEYDKRDKLLSLMETIKQKGEAKILIFVQTKKAVDMLADGLNRRGIFAMAIHGDISQARRERVLNRFRNDKSAVLVATDVAARGLDVDDIHHVINFDFPPTVEDYIHRIGRTARGTKTGVAHSFFTPSSSGLAKELIEVLRKAGQPVQPELANFVGKGRSQQSRYAVFGMNRQSQNYAF